MVLYSTSEYSELIDITIASLQDSQADVRQAAKEALSSLFMTCNSHEIKHFTNVFVKLAGPPPSTKNPNGTSEPAAMQAGVLGLAAIVQAVPYHVPDWLPDTITTLARYGHSKAPEMIRKEVQKSLQEFFRTHQDAWKQLHAPKFTETQLDILDAYKGRPSYFA